MDHLVRFETFVREGFLNGEHVVSIFFDLEKAYGTTWKYGIMKNLHDMDLRGRLPLFIQNFYLIGYFESEWGQPSLTFMIKKW